MLGTKFDSHVPHVPCFVRYITACTAIKNAYGSFYCECVPKYIDYKSNFRILFILLDRDGQSLRVGINIQSNLGG